MAPTTHIDSFYRRIETRPLLKYVGKFYIVPSSEFLKYFPEYADSYDYEPFVEALLPKRATSGSAGYDFCSLGDYTLKPGESVVIPTGIRVKIEDGWFLAILPRSSLGFNYRCQLDNTMGIIDSDYFNNEKNYGHIFIKITNDLKLPAEDENNWLHITRGKAFAQGIFLPYGITYDDHAVETRHGGIGSTSE